MGLVLLKVVLTSEKQCHHPKVIKESCIMIKSHQLIFNFWSRSLLYIDDEDNIVTSDKKKMAIR